MKYLALLLILFTPCLSLAVEKNFIREYTYKASDLDSKVSARKNTLDLIKANVLEEIISYTHNANTLEQAQANQQFRSSFIQSTTSSTAGFLKAKILEENWNGFEMNIRAKITADPEKIRNELERALALTPEPRSPAQSNLAQNPPTPTPTVPGIPVMTTAPDYSGYVRAAQFVQVVVLLQPLKLTMQEYHMSYGEWPSSLSQLNLSPDEMTDGKYLDKVRLGKDGLIFAYLSNVFGERKYLSLQPKSIMGGMNTRWDCNTNLNTQSIKNQLAQSCTHNRNLKYK